MYYRVLLKTRQDTTYNTAPVQLGSIVENTVGIIVGCMPVIQPAIISRCTKACRLFSLRSLVSRFSSRLRSSKLAAASSEKSPKDEASSKRIGRPYLETQILQGADGEGKFMTAAGKATGTRPTWLSRTILGTWTSGRTVGINTSAIGTTTTTNAIPCHQQHQVYNDSITVTTYLSSESHSSQEQGLNNHGVLQANEIQSMV